MSFSTWVGCLLIVSLMSVVQQTQAARAEGRQVSVNVLLDGEPHNQLKIFEGELFKVQEFSLRHLKKLGKKTTEIDEQDVIGYVELSQWKASDAASVAKIALKKDGELFKVTEVSPPTTENGKTFTALFNDTEYETDIVAKSEKDENISFEKILRIDIGNNDGKQNQMIRVSFERSASKEDE